MTSAYDRDVELWRANASARAARWGIAPGRARCYACDGEIHKGDPFRRVTKHDWPFCQTCAKARFDEDAPEVITPVARAPERLTFSRFVAPDLTTRLLGEREPGED